MSFVLVMGLMLGTEPDLTPAATIPSLPPVSIEISSRQGLESTNSSPTSGTLPVVTPAFVRQFDRNGDGRLSAVELAESKYARRFIKTDSNQDGFLDAREILQGKTKISRHARADEGMPRWGRGGLNEEGRAGQGRGLARIIPKFGRRQPSPNSSVGSNPAMQPTTPIPELPPPFPAGELPTAAPMGELPPMPTPALAPSEGKLPRGSVSFPESNLRTPPVPPVSNPRHSGEPAGKSDLSPDGLPTAKGILRNLDRNGNGQIDRSEAVDRLAENFPSIDRDKNGMLSEAELERALRLARMFGIKPTIDPRKYKQTP